MLKIINFDYDHYILKSKIIIKQLSIGLRYTVSNFYRRIIVILSLNARD